MRRLGRKVVRHSDSTYAHAGCTIRLRGDCRWLVTCHGRDLGIADTMIEAEDLADAHYMRSRERSDAAYTAHSMHLGEMGMPG